MEGIIKKLKDNLGNIIFPVTPSRAVYMEDGETNLDDKLVEYSNKIGDLSSLTTTEKSNLVGAVNETKTQLSENVPIRGTTQSITFNADGTVQKVQHKDSSNNLIREDAFTYATNLITEVRTLTSGGTLTFKYHLDTLQTEVI